jgi:hypothetical protein
MSSTLKSAMLLVLAVAMLASPALASARPSSTQIVLHPKRQVSFYRETLRTQLQADARFYAAPTVRTGSGSSDLGYLLSACLVLLLGAGAVAASRVPRAAIG